MIRLTSLAGLCLILSAILLLQSCKNSDPNPQAMLYKTWTLGSTGYVKQDGTNLANEYPGLIITFNGNGTYSTANGKKLFYPSGAWAWQGSGTSQIILDGDLPVDVIQINSTTLQIRFTMDVDHVNAGGRTAAVVGEYDVLLTAK